MLTPTVLISLPMILQINHLDFSGETRRSQLVTMLPFWILELPSLSTDCYVCSWPSSATSSAADRTRVLIRLARWVDSLSSSSPPSWTFLGTKTFLLASEITKERIRNHQHDLSWVSVFLLSFGHHIGRFVLVETGKFGHPPHEQGATNQPNGD